MDVAPYQMGLIPVHAMVRHPKMDVYSGYYVILIKHIIAYLSTLNEQSSLVSLSHTLALCARGCGLLRLGFALLRRISANVRFRKAVAD